MEKDRKSSGDGEVTVDKDLERVDAIVWRAVGWTGGLFISQLRMEQ